MEVGCMTPREFMVYLKACSEERDDNSKYRYDISMLNAYYNALFQRVKKMPDIKKFLSSNAKVSQPKQKQTPEDMFRVVKNLHAAYSAKK